MPDNEEDKGEKTKFNDLRKLQIVPKLLPKSVDQVCESIRNSTIFFGFKDIDYDSLDKVNK